MSRALLALAPVAHQRDTRSGVGTGRSVAGANQSLSFRPLLGSQFDRCVFAHAAQFSSKVRKCKIQSDEVPGAYPKTLLYNSIIQAPAKCSIASSSQSFRGSTIAGSALSGRVPARSLGGGTGSQKYVS